MNIPQDIRAKFRACLGTKLGTKIKNFAAVQVFLGARLRGVIDGRVTCVF